MKITKNAVVLILMVLIALLGVLLFKDERYNLVIILIVMLSCVPFYFKYEHDKPKFCVWNWAMDTISNVSMGNYRIYCWHIW